MASFIADNLSTEIGERVGYAIKFDQAFNEETNIVFVTPGVALRWFSENKLAEFDILMLDEFHERRTESDLLAGLLLKNGSHRLIITSATLDSPVLSAYFDAESIKAEGSSYGVTTSYMSRESSNSPSTRDLEQRVKLAVEVALLKGGDVLVFLPGRKEISACKGQLKHCSADVIELHAGVSDDERERALKIGESQKVVLATNVAETSLTIPNIVTVIDSGLERRTHQRNGRTVLALHAISKASARQRAGRAGRVREGFCVRLYGEFAPLESFTPPELEREELTDTLLAAACCGHRLQDLPLLSRLPEKSVNKGVEQLLAMRAIDSEGNATEHGKTLYPLPIDSLFAHLISGMTTKSHREAMVDLASVIQTPQKLWQLSRGEEVIDSYQVWNKYSCDAVTHISALRGEEGDMVDVFSDVRDEARKLSSSIREALELPHWQAPTRIQRESWLKEVMKLAPELVYVRREKRPQAFGNGFGEVLLGRDSFFPDEPQAAVVFDQFHLAGKRGAKQTSSYATCMAPIPLQWIVELSLCETTSVGTKNVDGTMMEVIEHRYGGRVIHKDYCTPFGVSLIKALAQAILDNHHFDIGTELVEQLAYWNLYQQLEVDPVDQSPIEAPIHWLTRRLEELGVETEDDLALIDGADLCFDGIPSWEYDGFREKYPLTVSLSDLHLSVEYFKAKRLVVIHHQSGKRKADPKRWELPRWNGWKVQYRKASRLIDIK
ncbi:helicase-related protein [Veronia nyctiphanis]|uniref:helicase-related protein n=1 Tax=Veronia nyctiphanis TaxID=1278244 RepID=UPI001F2EF0FF|nr:helicase-related protein [Veronia nyctiphanis]